MALRPPPLPPPSDLLIVFRIRVSIQPSVLRSGRSSPANTRAMENSSTLLNTTGATSPLNMPPTMPPTDIHR